LVILEFKLMASHLGTVLHEPLGQPWASIFIQDLRKKDFHLVSHFSVILSWCTINDFYIPLHLIFPVFFIMKNLNFINFFWIYWEDL
jgi:hypothetical protein